MNAGILKISLRLRTSIIKIANDVKNLPITKAAGIAKEEIPINPTIIPISKRNFASVT